ncbi:MAG TPA: hypothetical protein VJT09_07225 [Pyrinomonadaceae bacterium]|nr:hypothetical protein [Pyrinomonadaceae bacterium]
MATKKGYGGKKKPSKKYGKKAAKKKPTKKGYGTQKPAKKGYGSKKEKGTKKSSKKYSRGESGGNKNEVTAFSATPEGPIIPPPGSTSGDG